MGIVSECAPRVNDRFRGALSDKAELIEFFKFLDENVLSKKYLGKLYYDPKSPEYGLNNKTWQGYRPVKNGTYLRAGEKFAYRGKPVSLPKLLSRIRDFPNGVKQESKPYQKGAKPADYSKFEQTPTYELIMSRIKVDKNSLKNKIRNPEKYKKETTKKRNQYLYTAHLAWQAMGQNVDLLYAEEADWLKVWGEDPKTPNLCTEKMRDNKTGLIMYNHTVGLRWLMKNSYNQHVKDLIVSGDERFNTKGHKREVGCNIAKYFTEEQCFLLPYAIQRIDTLMLSYFGILFGGRFIALSEITPQTIDHTLHVLSVFESKVQKKVNKKIFEPETSFICQYIADLQIRDNQPLFSRSIKSYNDELNATKQYFAQHGYPLKWNPTTHTAFKHTCVTQMSLHGIRLDSISRYIGTDPKTLMEYYRGGSEEDIDYEIGGIAVKRQAPTWRAFVIKLTQQYAKRYEELTGKKINLPPHIMTIGSA